MKDRWMERLLRPHREQCDGRRGDPWTQEVFSWIY